MLLTVINPLHFDYVMNNFTENVEGLEKPSMSIL